ncbi:MAG TPA: hypothetical protein VF720_08475 [Candidatus Eisenbacteria bacterium]
MKAKVLTLVAVALIGAAGNAFATGTPQGLPFSQDWTNIGLITANDDWSGVPGILGFLGDNPVTSVTGVNPTSLVGDSSGVQDVIANGTNPNTSTAGGVGEFHITNPVVALQGSGTADFPHLRFHVVTTGLQSITFNCNLRDIDGSTDNANTPVAVQYRVGNAGNWTNVTSVADATTGPSLATLVTPVSAVLPAGANNQPEVQIRVLTTNSVGNDEWIGIDDISITGTNLPVPTETSSWSAIKKGSN